MLQDSFTTWGEFGPVLTMVLGDAFRDSLVWKRWQKSENGETVAVYGYTVPRAASHYAIDLCCDPSFRDQPGYHGEIYVDPSTGVIDRITAEPEYDESAPIKYSGIAIQYGRVNIEGRFYVCPHSQCCHLDDGDSRSSFRRWLPHNEVRKCSSIHRLSQVWLFFSHRC